MEHPLVIGILDIVEDKLHEFSIQIPDEVRDESTTDPIVGYTYAELHDRIMEYLEEQGVLDPNHHNINPTVTQADAIIKAANHAFFDASIPLSDINFDPNQTLDPELETARNAIGDLLEPFEENYDLNSTEYRTAIRLVEDLCLHQFPELYESITCQSDHDLIFSDGAGEYSMFYYNPDSVSGGQIVECSFNIDDAKRILNGEPYIDVLAEHTQYLNDIDTVHFFHTIFNLIEAKSNGMYLGSDINQVCKNILNNKEMSGTSLSELIHTAEQKTKLQSFPTPEKQNQIGGNGRER